jgi:hypothetical protein
MVLRAGTLFVLPVLAIGMAAAAQQPPPVAPARSARETAQADLTGQWVAEITEDWRWRMMTPPAGDHVGVPLSAAGLKLANAWDWARDQKSGEPCRAFGAGGLMRQPIRVRIGWMDDTTLRVEIDAGQQTRTFHFDRSRPAPRERTWQGYSVAQWTRALPQSAFGRGAGRGAPGRGGARGDGRGAVGAGPPAPVAPPAPPPGSLKVVTTRLRPGYLRKNGVPYSEQATVTEYYDRASFFGEDYLQLTTVVEDPVYLTMPLVTSNHFKRETDASKWNPTACATDPPVVKR